MATRKTDFMGNNHHTGRQHEAGILGVAIRADLIMDPVQAAGFNNLIGAANSRFGMAIISRFPP